MQAQAYSQIARGPYDISREFRDAAEWSRDQIAAHHPNEAFRAAARWVPVYLQTYATQEQAEAGGCATCTYLGLWTNQWPEYPMAPHGLIFLFEDGIRRARNTFRGQVYQTLEHELNHALGRDHVLDRLRELKMHGLDIDGMPIRADSRGCG